MGIKLQYTGEAPQYVVPGTIKLETLAIYENNQKAL